MIKRTLLPLLLLLLQASCFPLFSRKEEPSTLVIPPFWATIGFHKATQTEIYILLGGLRIDTPQGIAVSKLMDQDDPSTTGDDDELTCYAADSGLGLMAYNPSAASVAVFGRPGKDPETLKEPHGLAASPEGLLYIADTGNRRVLVLNNRKGVLSPFYSLIGPEEPYDIGFDKERNLYVTDRKARKIRVYDRRFAFQKDITHTRLKEPTGITVADGTDIWHYYKERFIVVINNRGEELLKFDLAGNLLKAVDMEKLLNKKVRMEYLTSDYYSQILVTDSALSTVHKLDRELNYITSFGEYGTRDFQFIEPRGIGIWRRFGQVFITESTGGQYYWVGVDIKDIKLTTGSTHGRVKFLLTEPAILEMSLFNEKKKKVLTIRSNERVYAYKQEIGFPLQDPAGEALKKGAYYLRISAAPTYSSRKVFRKEIEKKFVIP